MSACACRRGGSLPLPAMEKKVAKSERLCLEMRLDCWQASFAVLTNVPRWQISTVPTV